jgi:hypothetical protein
MIELAFLIPSLWQFLVLLFLMFESLLVGHLIVFHPMFNLQQIDAFQVFPFICTKCTTFWTNLIQNIILAYVWTPMFFWWGLITASILAYMIWYSNER